jgi:hypothetical protein
MAASAEELELLTKLLAFYKSRYQGKELEDKFNLACEDLISTNDIKHVNYVKFCVENDIEPKIRKPQTHISHSSGDGCGGGGRGQRGGC